MHVGKEKSMCQVLGHHGTLNHATINTHSRLFPSPVHEMDGAHTAFFVDHRRTPCLATWESSNKIPFGDGPCRELQLCRERNTFILSAAAATLLFSGEGLNSTTAGHWMGTLGGESTFAFDGTAHTLSGVLMATIDQQRRRWFGRRIGVPIGAII